MDKTKGRLELGEGGRDAWGVGGVVGGKERQLCLNNNKKNPQKKSNTISLQSLSLFFLLLFGFYIQGNCYMMPLGNPLRLHR